jgi:hypothetical protein
MADAAPDWAQEAAPDWAKAAAPLSDAPDWATPAAIPSAAKPTEQVTVTKPPEPTGPMPGIFEAIGQGAKSAYGDVQQSITALSSVAPQPSTEEPSPAAAPFEWGDLAEPLAKGAPKVAYRVAKSSPSLATGIAGGALGTGVGTVAGGPPGGVVGGLMGGVAGSAAGAALQTIGPTFADELKKSPQDPDGAWNRALHQAEISGAFSGAAWALFPARFFTGPLKQLAFQTFGVQPAVSVAEQATKNVVAGKPVTENLGQAYTEGAVGTAVPALGHAVLKGAMGERTTSNEPGSPIGDSSVANFWKRNFQPELVSDKALQADPQFAKYKSASAQERDSIINRAEENYYAWNKMPEEQRYDFMDRFEKGEKFDDPWMQERAETYREMLRQAHEDEAKYGSKAGYVEDYLPHIWKQPEKAAATFQNLALPQSLGPKWFQKARYYDLISAGRESGLELKTSNPEELVTMRLLSGADMRQRMELLGSLEQMGLAMPSEKAPASIANPSWRNAEPWQEISAPNKESWRLAPDVQPLWENAVNAQGLWANEGLAGNAFRGWMNLKNAWVPIKLALSAFHPLHVAHINLSNNISRALGETFGRGDQSLANRVTALPTALTQSIFDMALALPVGTPMRGKTGREAWLTPTREQTPEQRAAVKMFTEGGFSPQLSEQLRIAAKRGFNDAINNGQYLKALPIALRRSIEVVQKPIFEQWIPNLKAAAYQREAESLFRRRPDLLNDPTNRAVALRAIGKQIDNRFGEMFYGGLFWNRTAKDAAIGSFLSLGWNLGFAREFIGGALEPAVRQMMRAPTPTRQLIRDVTSKSTNAFVYTMTAMTINGLMNYAMTGQAPEGYDYIFPKIGGNNPDGSPRRITNMFYTREVPMAKKNIEERQSVIGGLAQMLYHKLMVAPFVEMATNRDYFGYQIYDENAPGFKQAYQLGSHILGDQLNPMSITGAKRSLELSGKPTDTASILQNLGNRDVALPLLGFGPAPAYASKTAIQNRIGYMYSQYVAPSEKPFAQKEQMDARRKAYDAYNLAMQTKEPEKISAAAQQLVDAGVKPKSIRNIKPGTQDIYMFGHRNMPEAAQTQILKESNKDEFKRYYPRAKKEVKQNPEIQALWKKYYQ